MRGRLVVLEGAGRVDVVRARADVVGSAAKLVRGSACRPPRAGATLSVGPDALAPLRSPPGCRGGTILNYKGSCVECPANTFSRGGDTTRCTLCPAGETSLEGSSRCFDTSWSPQSWCVTSAGSARRGDGDALVTPRASPRLPTGATRRRPAHHSATRPSATPTAPQLIRALAPGRFRARHCSLAATRTATRELGAATLATRPRRRRSLAGSATRTGA